MELDFSGCDLFAKKGDTVSARYDHQEMQSYSRRCEIASRLLLKLKISRCDHWRLRDNVEIYLESYLCDRISSNVVCFYIFYEQCSLIDSRRVNNL